MQNTLRKKWGNLTRKGMWQSGQLLTEEDKQLLSLLQERASQLGRTPTKREVPGIAKIKGRFRTWEHAVQAAGLPSLNDPGQIYLRGKHSKDEISLLQQGC